MLHDGPSTRGSSEPTAVGLIGVGRHGLRYVRHLLHDIPIGRLAAVARQSSAKGLPEGLPPTVPVYDSPERLLADPGIDVAVAVVPPILNPSIAEAAARAGVPLLLEKPLAVSLAEAGRILSAAAAGTALMIAHTLRFNAALCAFQQASVARQPTHTMRSLSLRLIVPMRPRPPKNPGFGGRGAWLDLGVHVADLLWWWLRPRSVTVQSAQITRAADGVDTAALVRIVTDEDIVCTLEVAWDGDRRVGDARVETDRGWMAVDWNAHRLSCGGGDSEGDRPSENMIEPQQTVQVCLTAFLQAVRTGSAMPVPLDAGYQALRLVEAGYQVAAQAVPVMVDGLRS